MASQDRFKIYTKTGDDGTSGLIGGTRVEKSDMRLEAYGTIDELNSWIGLIRTANLDTDSMNTLEFIQNKLFEIGSHLATDQSKKRIVNQSCSENDVEVLEKEIDRMQKELPELKNFILPGGCQIASYTHIARTVCRRAERRMNVLLPQVDVQKQVLIFVNRLSDYLFVLARYVNQKMGHDETIWNSEKS